MEKIHRSLNIVFANLEITRDMIVYFMSNIFST